jgi:hypothetical protein
MTGTGAVFRHRAIDAPVVHVLRAVARQALQLSFFVKVKRHFLHSQVHSATALLLQRILPCSSRYVLNLFERVVIVLCFIPSICQTNVLAFRVEDNARFSRLIIVG